MQDNGWEYLGDLIGYKVHSGNYASSILKLYTKVINSIPYYTVKDYYDTYAVIINSDSLSSNYAYKAGDYYLNLLYCPTHEVVGLLNSLYVIEEQEQEQEQEQERNYVKKKFWTEVSRIINRFCSGFCNFLSCSFFVLSIFLFGCLIIVFFDTLFSCNYKIDCSAKGVSEMQMFWCNYKDLITTLGGCLTLFVITYNLKKFTDVETVKALGDLRDKLNTPEKKKIHSHLMKTKKPILPINITSNVELYDYLGTLELGVIMENKGIISFDEFYRQFGYRVRSVAKNDKIRRYVKRKNKSYKVLKEMVNKFIEKGKLDAKYKL